METEHQRLNGKNFDKYNKGISNWKWKMREDLSNAIFSRRFSDSESAREEKESKGNSKSNPRYKIRAAHAAVFWYLLFHASQDKRLVHTSNDKLAEYTWQSRRTIQKVIQDFLKWNIIEKVNKRDIPGQWTTYRMIVKSKY